MANYSEERLLPYGHQKLFDIVADVERYPEFLPGWIDAQVLSREKNHVLVRQTLGIGHVHTQFRSRADFQSPEKIIIQSDDWPFQHLEIAWYFEPSGEYSSRVRLAVSVHLKRVVFRELLESWFSSSASSILSAFERRAEQLYAKPAS